MKATFSWILTKLPKVSASNKIPANDSFPKDKEKKIGRCKMKTSRNCFARLGRLEIKLNEQRI